MPVQLKQKRPCEGCRAEQAVFDHPPRCAAIRCSHRDDAVLHDIPARYAFAVIFHADFFIHNDDPLNAPAVSPSGSMVMLATKGKALALGATGLTVTKDEVRSPTEAAHEPLCR
jgi:hypothetical protein